MNQPAKPELECKGDLQLMEFQTYSMEALYTVGCFVLCCKFEEFLQSVSIFKKKRKRQKHEYVTNKLLVILLHVAMVINRTLQLPVLLSVLLY